MEDRGSSEGLRSPQVRFGHDRAGAGACLDEIHVWRMFEREDEKLVILELRSNSSSLPG
jgi:hypothetical protein